MSAGEARPAAPPADCAELDARLGLPELRFAPGAGGLACARFESGWASASVCMQGAQVLEWQPRSQSQPVIWLSAAARFEAGRAIRGGIPVCWPWFGAPPAAGLPNHGFARTQGWQAQGSGHTPQGAAWLALRLEDDEHTRALWPGRFRLELRITVGAELELELTTCNLDGAPLQLSEALHAYFRVGDVGALRVEGLEGRLYRDALAGGRVQRQRGAVEFAQETDRLYSDPGPACVIVDPVLRRRIIVAKTGSASTVVWNPWSAKAERLGDVGPDAQGADAWRRMVCLESANAGEHLVRLAARATHTLAARYRVEALR